MATTQHKGATLSFQPRIRRGAFFEASWKHGCRSFSVYNRTYISSTFSDPITEYWKVIEDVAVCPVMGERQVEISGPDASDFVQYLTTRDMRKCAVNQCKYALLTDSDGGIISDPIVLRIDDNRYWLSTSDCDLELWAKGVAVNAGMQVTIADVNVSAIQVQGPKSPRLMVDLFGEGILDLRYYWLCSVDFQGSELKISRTGWSGEFGYEIYLQDASLGEALFDALMEAGKACDAVPAAVNHARRIESGILSWGIDITPAETPYEVGLGRLVELDDTPDFIGRAALERLKNEPLKKQLVGLHVEGDALEPNEDVWLLTSKGHSAGKLTSLAHSPRLERNIAIGLVRPEFSNVGTSLEVETWTGTRAVTVSAIPFLPKRQQSDPRDLFASA